MSPKIASIIKQAPQHLAKLLEEAADQIEEALVAAATEAQLQESEAKLGLGFKITLHLDKNAVQYGLSWSVKHALTSEATLPDPNQPELPVVMVTVTSNGDVNSRMYAGLTKAEIEALDAFRTPSTEAQAPAKRGRGRPRKNTAPSNSAPGDTATGPAIAPEPSQGEAAAPETVPTDPESLSTAPEASEEAAPEVSDEPVVEAPILPFGKEFQSELKEFVESRGFTFAHCKAAAKGFNILDSVTELATDFEELGEKVSTLLLNAKRGFASRMALIKQTEEAQNPPEI